MATKFYHTGFRNLRRITTLNGEPWVQGMVPGPNPQWGSILIEDDPPIRHENAIPYPWSDPLAPGEIDGYVAVFSAARAAAIAAGAGTPYNPHVYHDVVDPTTGARTPELRTFPSDEELAANRQKCIDAGVPL